MRSSIIIAGVIMVAASAVPANADIADQIRAHEQIGYARAAVKACPELSISPSGVLGIMKDLSAEDQAAVAGNDLMTDRIESDASKLLTMLGEHACEAALDFEAKMKIDLFVR